MSEPTVQSQPTELEVAASNRRSFGNAELAANAEFKVIAEALRELVIELRMIRTQVGTLVATATGERSNGASKTK
jgi:hypothetical protein